MDHIERLECQKSYYDARADEGAYDDWLERRGAFDGGLEENRQWLAERDEIVEKVQQARMLGRVLDIACGTGWWTRYVATPLSEVHALDSSAAMLDRCRDRLRSKNVTLIESDIFEYQPERQFAAVFFSFWLSHVPVERFETFWNLVREWLLPNGFVLFVDHLFHRVSVGSNIYDPAENTSLRTLADGSNYEIVKIFYTPAELESRLMDLGWRSQIIQTRSYFFFARAWKA